MKKLRLLLATLLAIVGATNVSAQDAYAVYTSDNTTLTFYYDSQRSSHTGTYDLNTGNSEPAWYEDIYDEVTTVVFDPSFADARPTSTSCWFLEMENLTTITGLTYLNTSEVTSMASMFNACSNLISVDLSHFDTSKVTDMSFMFSNCSELRILDLLSFNTVNVANMFDMFFGCSNLTTIIVGGGWNTEKVNTSNDMFIGCTNLKGGAGTAYLDENPSDKTYARIDNPVNNEPGYLTEGAPEPYAVLDGSTLTFYYDNSKATHVGTKYSLLYGSAYYSYPGWTDSTNGNATITSVDFDESFDDYRLTSAVNLFNGLSSLSTINNIERLHTDEVTTMQGMFKGCSSLTSLDLSYFITAKVTNMQEMFSGCSSLTSLDLSNFITEEVTSMYRMFWQCSGLTAVDISSFVTSKVTSMTQMFTNCSNLTELDLRNFVVGYIDANYMFQTCSKLQTIYCNDKWILRSSTSMFAGCTSLSSPAMTQYNSSMIDGSYANPTTGYFTQKVDIPGAEAYAILNGSTLTLYYDDQKDNRVGTPYVITMPAASSKWYGNSSITIVDFDESFAYYDGLTILNNFFGGLTNLTEIRNLPRMNTKNVTSMSSMFTDCASLTELDLSGFNTKKVTSMVSMFFNCSSLQKIIVGSNWSTESLSSRLQTMFNNCTSLAGSSGTTYDENHINAFYAHIDGGTSNQGYLTGAPHPYAIYTESSGTLVFYYDDQADKRPATYRWTFSEAEWKNKEYIQHVYFDSSFANCNSLTNLHALFYGCRGITDFNNLYNLNTENVTDMSMMFYNCRMESIDLSNFSTGKVVDMSDMFGNCSALTTLNVNSFDTQNVTDMRDMFSGCTNLKTIYCDNDWNKTGLTSSNMFDGCTKLPNFDSSKTDATMANPTTGYFKAKEAYAVKYADKLTFYYDNERINRMASGGTFYDLPTTTETTPAWTSNTDIKYVDFDESFDNYHGLTSAYRMFYEMQELIRIDNLDRLHTENVKSMWQMFYDCPKLGYAKISSLNTSNVWNMGLMFYGCSSLTSLDLSGWNTDQVTYMREMFFGCSSLTSLDLSSFNTANVTTMYRLFNNCSSLTSLDLSSFNTANVTTMQSMFFRCSSLTSLNLSNFNTANVTDMYGMFENCSSLTSLNLSGWNTAQVTNMSRMFDGCRSLTPLDLSSFSTANVTNMYCMFLGCSSLTSLNLSGFNTANVTEMGNMFSGCSSLTSLDLSSFSTANVTDMYCMFIDCSSLTSLDLSNFNTANVTDMYGMFKNCSSLTSLDLSSFNTANVTTMQGMFEDCSSLTYLDLSSFNTAKVTEMNSMFRYCSNLATIYVGDGWSVTALTDSGNLMFYDCTSLVGGMGTTYDENHVNAEYARYDAGQSSPGYFSKASAYAVLSTDGKTLSFYYDYLKETREGTKYSLQWDTTGLPGWTDSYNGNQNITTVNIDPSMARYHGLTYAAGMFFHLGNVLAINGLEYLNTENVTNMSNMFTLSGLKTLNLTHFDVGKVTDMHDMFLYCTNLKTIYCNDNWKSDVVINSETMFYNCPELVGAISYDANKTDVDYANPNDGYFTKLEAYAAYTADNTTLTFYYDNLRSTRGTTYNANTGSIPGWFADLKCSYVTNVVFDASFADARPTSTCAWFRSMKNLTTITGISNLNTSKVTNMAFMFERCNSLTSLDLSSFNTENVTRMDDMFNGCERLESLNLSSFNTENVTSMLGMFHGCQRLESLDVSSFNTAKVWSMQNMFYRCWSLTSIDLSSFNTAQVKNMEYMFGSCNLTTLDLSSFNTAKVTDMESMFDYCQNLTTIYVGSGWNTDAVTTSDDMFRYCSSLVGGKGTTFDENHIDKEYARIDGGPSTPGYFTDKNDMSELEAYAVYTASNTTLTFYYDKLRSTRGTTYNYDLNTNSDPAWRSEGISSSVTNVVFDPSFADALPTTTMSWFNDMSNLETITGFEYLNTSEVTSMQMMFGACSKLTSLDLSGWNVENVSVAYGMFAFCSSLQTIDLTEWKTTNLTSTAQMFFCCNNLTTVYVSDDWTTERVTNSDDMFDECSSIRGGKGTPYDATIVDKTYARIDGGSSTPGYFTDKNTLPEPELKAYAVYTASNTTLTFYYDNLRDTRTGTTYDLNTGSNEPEWKSDGTNASVTNVVFDPSFATARPTTTYEWFKDMTNLTTITGIEYLNTSEVTDMRYMFDQCGNLTTLDVSSFNTANVTNMAYMFRYCSNLKSLDVSSFNTENVTNMAYMFFDCEKLTSLVVSSFNTENVTDMSHMFSNCRELTSLDLSSFNTANVTDMTYMFASCWDLASLDVSSFNTENVTDMRSMFAGCTLLTSLDVSSFNTEKVTNMHGMFYFCSSLPPLDVSSFNTANVTDMGSMFGQCDRLTTLDLSSFNTAKVTDMSNMFYGCYALTTICVGTGWNTDAVSTSEYMFYRCSNLVGGKGTTYDENHIDKDYARIDGGPDNPGYLTGAPYLVLNGTTLTFYDDGDNNKEGTVYNLRDWSVRAEGVGDDVTTVVFDPSFADARPIYTVAWFYNMANLTTITGMENLNTSEVTAMTGMFANCTSLTTLDLSSFNTANVENMVAMFNGCTSLTTIYAGDGWTTDKVAPAYGSAMFTNCTALVGGNGTAYATAGMVDISFARIDGGPESETPGYFTYKAAFKLGDVNGDGTVSIADVTAVVSYILSNGHPTGTFNIDAANADGIEGITISDAMAIVNLILNK